jgi:drug/metabolite transporter (DMT)-like permease
LTFSHLDAMSRILLGILAAFLAAGLYGLGVGMQAREARVIRAHHSLRLSLLRLLVARRLWLVGTLAGLGGWAAQMVALLYAPLTLVRPVLAASLVVLLVIGTRVLDEPVGRAELFAVSAIVAGVAGLSWAAPPHASGHAGATTLVVPLVALAAAAVLPYALLGAGRRPDAVLAPAAGLAYAWDGLATKFAADDLRQGALAGLLFWLVSLSAAVVLGMLSEMSALQRRPATRVAPVVFVASTIVPVLLAPVLADERWSPSPLAWATLLGSLGLVLVAVVVIARSGAVAAVIRAAARDFAPSPTPAPLVRAQPNGVSVG